MTAPPRKQRRMRITHDALCPCCGGAGAHWRPHARGTRALTCEHCGGSGRVPIAKEEEGCGS